MKQEGGLFVWKNFLKILLIIIGIVFLIFAALICIGLFVDYDSHIENGRYTYVPEEENKGNEYIEFKLTDNGKDDSKLTYYNSIEEAILNSPLKQNMKIYQLQKIFLIMLMKYCIYGMANSMIRFSIEQEVITIPFKVLWLHAAKNR